MVEPFAEPLIRVVGELGAVGYTFVAIIFALFLWHAPRILRPINQLAKSFQKAAKRLEATDRIESARGVDPFEGREQVLVDLWEKFAEKRRENIVVIEDERLSSTEPESVFTEHAVLVDVNRRLSRALPGIFAGIGILGTFVGLVYGLANIDPEQLMPSVRTMLGGMATAFVSSLFGIFFSVFWLLLDRTVVRRLEREKQRFMEVVRRRLPVTRPEKLLATLTKSQVRSQQLLESQDASMRSLSNDLASAFEQALHESFEKQLAPELATIGETLDQLSGRVSDQQAQALSEMASEFQRELTDVVHDEFEAMAEVLHETTEWQQQVNEDVSDLFERLSEMGERQTDVIDRSREAAELYRGTLDELRQSHERLATVSEHLEKVGQSTAELSQELEAQVEVHQEANAKIRQELASHLDQIQVQVDFLSETWRDVGGRLDRIADDLAEKTAEFTELIEDRIGQTFATFDSEMSEITDHLSGTLAELREINEDLLPGAQRLHEAIDESLSPVRENRETFENLAASVNRLEDLPGALVQASSQVDGTQERIDRLTERLEHLDGRLEEILKEDGGAPERDQGTGEGDVGDSMDGRDSHNPNW